METARNVPAVVLPAPASMPEREGSSSAWTTTLPMLGGVGSMLMVAGSTGAGSRGYVVGGLFLASTVALAVVQVVRQHRQYARKLVASRARHRLLLNECRARVHTVRDAQRRAAEEQVGRRTPTDSGAPRTAGDPGFGSVRVGEADLPLAAELEVSDEEEVGTVDPVTSQALDAFISTWSTTHGVPTAVDLMAADELHVRGTEQVRTAAARALVVRAASCHSYDDLRIAVLTTRDRLYEWEWLKWLPHARASTASDDVGGCRLVLHNPVALEKLLAGDTAHLLLVLDDVPHLPAINSSVTTVFVDDRDRPSPHRIDLVDHRSGSSRLHRRGEPTIDLDPDLLGRPEAEAAARTISRGEATFEVAGRPAPEGDVHALLGMQQLGPASHLPSRPVDQRLAVAIGRDLSGAPVALNLRESAYGGVGPHGLVVGATGSGKSELLRTLVLALAAQHRPDELALVLVDFKGGATFAGLGDLPHVSALVTNLADDLTLVSRMEDSLTGELERRQEVLHAAGHANLHEYDTARRGGADLPPLPSLFICVDEFSELLTARPEFIELFVAIGRLGRSLGVHLLLATQRLEEGRLRGLESHLSYRVGLRTFSAAESRAAIGVPDAHGLPARPGVGLLKQGAAEPLRFEAAYVSGPVREVTRSTARVRAPLLPFALTPVLLGGNATDSAGHDPQPAPERDRTAHSSMLDRVVADLSDGTRVRQIWLPPLDAPSTLGDHRDSGALVLGEVDLPREQRRVPLTFDLGGAAGHFAVVGGPRSGRSTVLQSVVSSLALASGPDRAQFLLLDLGGGSLAPLEPLPHVLALARRGEDLVERVAQEAYDLVDRREVAFRETGATSVAEHRARTGQPLPDVYVVVDGWGTLRSEHEDQEFLLSRLAARGLTFGVHLVLATTRWNDLRPTLRDLVGSRLELRLGDALDSEVDRRAAARVPSGRPGRGIDAGARDVLTCLPRIDGRNDPDTAQEGLQQLVASVSAGWEGARPARLRVLPEQVRVTDLPPTLRTPTSGSTSTVPSPGSTGLLIGLDEDGTGFTALDDPHLLVLGDDRSGRTETLRTVLRQLCSTHSPDLAQVIVVDPRGGLRDVVGDEHLIAHLSTRSRIISGLAELATHLTGRLPGPEVTAQQLADRSWWSGPEVYVVVDDHDLVTAGSWQESPTRPLAELLAQAHEIGLHLVLARRTDTARAHDPVLTALQELSSPTLLLPGNPTSGPVAGHLRPRPGPPGRGRYLSRRAGVRTVQVALSDNPDGPDPRSL